MVSAEEILKSLQDEMQKCSDEFKNINDIIEKTTQEYNDKISQLLTRKEQVRGTYTGLYNQYQKFVGTAPNNAESNSENVSVPEVAAPTETVEKEEVPAVEEKPDTSTKVVDAIKKEQTKQTKQTKTGLTPEERAKLKQVTTKQTDKKGNEIPEYLQDSYNK